MPTVILLDLSLSMVRSVPQQTGEDELQRRALAVHGIITLVDHIASNTKLEFVSLVVFSSLWELVVPFTRDFDAIKAALVNIEAYDKTCIETALDGVRSIVMDEWGAGVPCQVVIFTDGCSGVGPSSLKSRLASLGDKESFVLPYPFPCKLHVVCIATAAEAASSVPLFNKLIDLNGGRGNVYVPEMLTIRGIQQAVSKMVDIYYQSFHCTLKCGHLNSQVTLFPSPIGYDKVRDFVTVKKEISSVVSICCFMDMSDVGSPCAYTRHLVLPIPTASAASENNNLKEVGALEISENGSDDETTGSDDGKEAHFCVLLHGSLKVENMVAICRLTDDWYGMLYSWADTRKKSNLMLSIFEPGNNSVPWFGKIDRLAPLSLFSSSPYGEKDDSTPFPVRTTSERRSYAQSCVVWIKQSGLQADIQKVLRHARKLPEKSQHFYKELNRLRRAALSFGFYPLLEGIASIIDRECQLLPGSAHPEAALQLSYAANALRSASGLDVKHTITALRTKFSSNS